MNSSIISFFNIFLFGGLYW